MDAPSFDISGQVALVTGASRGIGRDLVLALAAAGARVAAGARNPAGAEDVVREAVDGGGEAAVVEMDLTDRASLGRAG
jgi:NAD(P)-dependent dehydrogenase (short-subunit alcohol dehydrogenase family)